MEPAQIRVLPSERASRFGRVMFRRAVGTAPEMDCARALAKVVGGVYEPGMRVLDVGCGAGHYLRSLRQRVDPSVAYHGVDVDQEYVLLAREAFPEVPFAAGDVHRLPFADRSFDVVFAANVLPNLPPPPTAAIAELVRVARRCVVLRTLFGHLNYVIREFVPAVGGGDHLDPEHALFNNMYSEAFYRSMVDEAAPGWGVEIFPDDDWQGLEAEASDESWRTRVVGGKQIAGQLVLDWRFVVLSPGD